MFTDKRRKKKINADNSMIIDGSNLLLGLAATKSSSELHRGGARAGSSGLVSLSRLPVGLSVGLSGHASGPERSY